MSKSKYIKITDRNGKSSVVMGDNETFYKSQAYKISEPAPEEIEQYFPSAMCHNKAALSELESSLAQLKLELTEERAEHLSTKNLLEQANADLASAQKELDKLKKKA